MTRILNQSAKNKANLSVSFCQAAGCGSNENAIIGSEGAVSLSVSLILAWQKRHFINIMGEAKRRKDTLGEKYGKEAQLFPWLRVTKSQAQQFVQWSNRGAWIGIGLLVAWWVTIRFIGPGFGLWQVN